MNGDGKCQQGRAEQLPQLADRRGARSPLKDPQAAVSAAIRTPRAIARMRSVLRDDGSSVSRIGH